MKDFIARFRAPLVVARPRGSRLLEASSPTLERRVQFFDRTNFALWIRLDQADRHFVPRATQDGSMGQSATPIGR